MSERLAGSAGSALVAIAVAVVIVATAIIPFVNPAWLAFAQERAEAAAWTGFTTAELRTVTDAILADLVLGPPDFDGAVAGQPVLNPRERGHLADVRSAFAGFAALAVVSVVVLAATVVGRRTSEVNRIRTRRAARRGAISLAVGVILLGLVGAFAFEPAFEVFHRLFFAGGSYTFNSRTERLVQLFPQRLWFETSMAVGAVVLLLACVVAAVATRRLRTPRPVGGQMPVLGAAG